jgi:branched-chain amino acid transport system permease protein
MAYLSIQLLNGLQYGLVLFLVAAGLTLIFGLMGVLNLAHGSFYMIGAYLFYTLFSATGQFWLSLLLVALVSLAIGAALERSFFRFLYHRDHLYQLLLTFGLIVVLGEARAILFGNSVLNVPIPAALDFGVRLFGLIDYPFYRIFLMAVCGVLALAMYGLIAKTQAGRYIRAANANIEVAKLLGIDTGRVFTAVFAIGVALTSLAGALMAPITTIYPGIGGGIIVISFVIVVTGGVGSIKGAFVAAILVGMVETVGQILAPGIAAVAPYAAMAIVLWLRPDGLFPKTV